MKYDNIIYFRLMKGDYHYDILEMKKYCFE